MGIIRKILKSASLWSMIGVALRVGGGVITLPIALRNIPKPEMGLYYTFLSLTSIAALLDFGFAQSVSRNAAFAMGGAKKFQGVGIPESMGDGKPNWELLADLLKAVKIWYQRVGVVLCLLLMSLGTIFLKDKIAESGLPNSLVYCWLLYAFTASYGFVTTYWPDLLMGIGSVTKAARIALLSQGVGLVLLLAGLLGGFGLWAYPVSSLIASAIGRNMAKRAFLKEATPILDYSGGGNVRAVFSSLWPMAWRQGVVMIGAFLIQRGNTIVCTSELGFDETASFGLSVNILNLIFQVAVIPLAIAWPLISKLRIERKNQEIKKIFWSRLYAGLAGAAIAIIGVSLWGSMFIDMIGSKSSLLPSGAFLFLGLVMWLETHHSQYGGLVLTENHNPFVIPAILSGLSILCLSVLAANKWGVIGIIGSQFVVQLAWNNWWTVRRGLKGLNPATIHS